MTRTTRAQRIALKRVYDRGPLPLTYRQFRARVQPVLGCRGVVCVPWASMWLVIEVDGYVHS